jgi:inosine-uridine nucleoside N-ribohydrolase
LKKVVLDTDPGWDDALVLLLLLAKRDIDLLCVTTVWGNEDVQATTTNARRMTYYLGRGDIPIYVGAMQAMKATFVALPCPTSTVVRALPPLGTVVNGPPYAPEMLVDMARKHGPELTILGIGSMTNIAAAVQTDPAAMKRVGALVLTGGSFKGYQTHEFNLGCDSMATQLLLDAHLNPVIITFDTEMTMNRGATAQEKMRAAGEKGNRYAGFYAEVVEDQLTQKNKEANEGVFDQLAALYALDPTAFCLEQKTIVIDYHDPIGRIREDPAGRPARIATVNVDRAYDLLYRRLGLAP